MVVLIVVALIISVNILYLIIADMFSQSLFNFFKKVAIDGRNCVMKVMRFSLVFQQQIHVKELVRTICDARLI